MSSMQRLFKKVALAAGLMTAANAGTGCAYKLGQTTSMDSAQEVSFDNIPEGLEANQGYLNEVAEQEKIYALKLASEQAKRESAEHKCHETYVRKRKDARNEGDSVFSRSRRDARRIAHEGQSACVEAADSQFEMAMSQAGMMGKNQLKQAERMYRQEMLQQQRDEEMRQRRTFAGRYTERCEQIVLSSIGRNLKPEEVRDCGHLIPGIAPIPTSGRAATDTSADLEMQKMCNAAAMAEVSNAGKKPMTAEQISLCDGFFSAVLPLEKLKNWPESTQGIAAAKAAADAKKSSAKPATSAPATAQ